MFYDENVPLLLTNYHNIGNRLLPSKPKACFLCSFDFDFTESTNKQNLREIDCQRLLFSPIQIGKYFQTNASSTLAKQIFSGVDNTHVSAGVLGNLSRYLFSVTSLTCMGKRYIGANVGLELVGQETLRGMARHLTFLSFLYLYISSTHGG